MDFDQMYKNQRFRTIFPFADPARLQEIVNFDTPSQDQLNFLAGIASIANQDRRKKKTSTWIKT